MKINYTLLKAEFKEYLIENGISLDESQEDSIASASIFEYGEEFKEFVNEKYNIDLDENSIKMSELNGAEVKDGKFVVEESDEISDEATIMLEVLNGMFEDEEFALKLDSSQDGSLDNEEIKNFLSFSKEKSEDGKCISFDDLKNSIFDINDGKYELELPNLDTDGIEQASSGSSGGGSVPSGGGYNPPSTDNKTQEEKQDFSKMDAEQLETAQKECQGQIGAQSEKINSTVAQNQDNEIGRAHV